MKIVLAHSGNYDYEKELYVPIENSNFLEPHNIVFPHKNQEKRTETREELRDADLFIAEVSYPSTGEGIEIGMATMLGVPILFIHKEDVQPSSSLGFIESETITYGNSEDLIEKLERYLQST